MLNQIKFLRKNPDHVTARKPRAIFNDPFRGYPHVMVLADAWQARSVL